MKSPRRQTTGGSKAGPDQAWPEVALHPAWMPVCTPVDRTGDCGLLQRMNFRGVIEPDAGDVAVDRRTDRRRPDMFVVESVSVQWGPGGRVIGMPVTCLLSKLAGPRNTYPPARRQQRTVWRTLFNPRIVFRFIAFRSSLARCAHYATQCLATIRTCVLKS
jgi:hypothetical protein